MEDFKEKAKEFCEAEGISIFQGVDRVNPMTGSPVFLINFIDKFLQSMIDQGDVVEAEKTFTLADMHECWIQSSKNTSRESLYFKEWISTYKQSTVSSAGKEVKTFEEIFKEEYPNNRIPSGVLDTFIEAGTNVSEKYANQFKSSPASTEISNEQIKRKALEMYSEWSKITGLGVDEVLILMGKWVRSQLTGK